MIKIGICDDEGIIRAYVRKILEKENTNYICYEYESAEQTFQGEEADIFILDIEMSGMNGIELAEKLRKKDSKTYIIFLTSHVEIVEEAFKVRAYRFLKKPISEEKLLEAVGQAEKEICEQGVLLVKDNEGEHIVNIRDILFLEAFGDGTYIYTTKKVYTTMKPLKKWEECLKTELFQRTHKSYIVSMAYITSVMEKEVLIEESRIPIARRNRKQVKQAFSAYIEKNARYI